MATVLRDLAESRAIDLELLAGGGGVDRRITNPHPQKTGLALSGFDKYLREGRVLVLGESEVRFLESLPPSERTGGRPPGLLARAALPRDHRRLQPAAGGRRRGGSRERAADADARGDADGDGAAVGRARRLPRRRGPSSTAC